MYRPLSLLARALVLSLTLAGLAEAQTLTTERIVSGLSAPVYVTSAPGDTESLFVVERGGRIQIIRDGAVLPAPFLDIDALTNGGGEQGLLGLAFHPDYQNNRRFFVNFTNLSGNTRVWEYEADPMNPDVALPTMVQTIFLHSQPFNNHNGGCIAFGPDGMLYIGMGDGGSANDPGNRSQDPQNTLGKMIRLNVDIPAPFIPADNPFVSDSGVLDEIWSFGLRNPWRFSFDMATGDLYIADVGQNTREEVNFAPASSPGGENYGWRCMEGEVCTGLSGCTCNDAALTLPVTTYNHQEGRCSITGGFVYRSAEIPALQGTYFYADFCSSQIFSFRMAGGVVTEATDRTAELAPAVGSINNITSFGQDAAGNVYICDFGGGEIFKIVEECAATPFCSATVNSTGAAAAIGSTGDTSISSNSLQLTASNLPPNETTLFFYGNAQVQASFGDGLRCVGGMTVRLNPSISSSGQGTVSRDLDFTAPPLASGAGMISPGSTWNFQLWFRDSMGPGGTGFNLSDGLEILFCP